MPMRSSDSRKARKKTETRSEPSDTPSISSISGTVMLPKRLIVVPRNCGTGTCASATAMPARHGIDDRHANDRPPAHRPRGDRLADGEIHHRGEAEEDDRIGEAFGPESIERERDAEIAGVGKGHRRQIGAQAQTAELQHQGRDHQEADEDRQRGRRGRGEGGGRHAHLGEGREDQAGRADLGHDLGQAVCFDAAAGARPEKADQRGQHDRRDRVQDGVDHAGARIAIRPGRAGPSNFMPIGSTRRKRVKPRCDLGGGAMTANRRVDVHHHFYPPEYLEAMSRAAAWRRRRDVSRRRALDAGEDPRRDGQAGRADRDPLALAAGTAAARPRRQSQAGAHLQRLRGEGTARSSRPLRPLRARCRCPISKARSRRSNTRSMC